MSKLKKVKKRERCPKCKSRKTQRLWERLLWCEGCRSCSVSGETRYILVCSEDRTKLVPRMNFENPVVVCPECGKEYKVPEESVAELVVEDL